MKHQIINNEANDRLTLVFLGWGMDPNALTGTKTDGQTVALWDYTDMTLPAEVAQMAAASKKDVHVMAWSMGVWAAETTMVAHPEISWGYCRAYCGAPMAVDDDFGVPKRIAKLTADNWNEENRKKFCDKMFAADGGSEACAKYMSQRDIADQQAELHAIIAHSEAQKPHALLVWDECHIGKQDKIINGNSQWAYWSQGPCAVMRIEVELGHFPFRKHYDLRVR